MRVGGGANHRFGLDDAVLIKDNHVAAAGGIDRRSSAPAPASAIWSRSSSRSTRSISCARRSRVKVDAVLLDNMDDGHACARRSQMVGGRAITEASGGITLASAPAIAATGVDLLSAGWLTHSTTALDIGLDWKD